MLYQTINCPYQSKWVEPQKTTYITAYSPVIMESPLDNMKKYFGQLKDPRVNRTQKHKLEDIVSIAICSVICGADSWVGVEEIAKSKKEWFEEHLYLPNGIPSHDTFGRVFAKLDPDEFQKQFTDWTMNTNSITSGQVIGVDGKTVRGSRCKRLGKKGIHIVSAWASKNNLVLGQIKVNNKSNEITAIPELLDTLSIKNCVITIDAMGCQKKIAQKIVDCEANYVFGLKKNQPNLHEDVTNIFKAANLSNLEDVTIDYYQTMGKGHGRLEIRQCWTISLDDVKDKIRNHELWANFNTIVMIRGERYQHNKAEIEDRFFISSLENDAKKLLSAVRTHWSIENSLHWVLDVAFNEDKCRVRTGHAPENFSTLRRIALNLLKQENEAKCGIKIKRKKACANDNYLEKVLSC